MEVNLSPSSLIIQLNCCIVSSYLYDFAQVFLVFLKGVNTASRIGTAFSFHISTQQSDSFTVTTKQ